MSRTYTISELAREFGLTPRAIRFYEDKGLVAPTRIGQNRLFNARDRVRLSLIVQGKKVGFSLSEIRDILDLYDVDEGRTTQLKFAVAKFRSRIEQLIVQRREIDQAIDDLEAACAAAEKRLADAGEDADLSLIGYSIAPSNPTTVRR